MFQRSKNSRRRRIRWAIVGLLVALLIAWSVVDFPYWTYREAAQPMEIFQGVTYSCENLPQERQGGGRLYLVRVDLHAPGIELYATPVDPGAAAQGWEYRMSYASSEADRKGLAVSVNGTLFSHQNAIPLPGGFARGNEGLVADHTLSHSIPSYCWMLSFDDDLTPYLPDHRPPTQEDLNRAKWGIGTQQRILTDGKVGRWGSTLPDHRTVLAINKDKHLLWLACFESASYLYAARILAEHGATDAIMLDGGRSTSMAIGNGATGLSPGTVIGCWQPVANFWGIRARPLQGR